MVQTDGLTLHLLLLVMSQSGVVMLRVDTDVLSGLVLGAVWSNSVP